MKASECVQLFELHHQLLALYEPQDAVLWLVTKQKSLDGRMPCDVLSDARGYTRLARVISEMTTSSFS